MNLPSRFTDTRMGILAVSILAIMVTSGILLMAALPHIGRDSEFSRTHTQTFFEQTDFNRGLKKDDLFTLDADIYGGIVPHHLLPSEALSTFFSQLQKQNPKRIILISPNHFKRGTTPLITSPYGYNTPFGTVKIDQNLYEKITNEKNKLRISRDDNTMDNEHGIGNLMSYIKYYLPKTTLMPVILWPNTTEEQIDTLTKTLAPLIDEDTILLASIDFSHYLPAQTAEEKDQITWRLITGKNDESILKLNNNDHLDSPPSLVTLLKTMEIVGAAKIKKLYHSNSGFLMGNMTIPTTSYFILSFTK